MKDRQAFNFYRSYYDVIVELPDGDKLPFIMAILNKQFLDVEPQLTGITALLYKSQKHSIEKQVNGYKAKMGITTPTQGPTEANTQNSTFAYQGPTEANKGIEAITSQVPTQGPSVQGEGEGQEEEEEQAQGEEQGATTPEEQMKRKYKLGEELKSIFKPLPDILKLIDREDFDPIQRSCTELFNKHYETIYEYKSIKI
jgi:hypothetical protein